MRPGEVFSANTNKISMHMGRQPNRQCQVCTEYVGGEGNIKKLCYSEGRSVVGGKRLCLIILILSDIGSVFLGSMQSVAEYVHQKDSCQHTKLHLLHTLDTTDLRFC